MHVKSIRHPEPHSQINYDRCQASNAGSIELKKLLEAEFFLHFALKQVKNKNNGQSDKGPFIRPSRQKRKDKNCIAFLRIERQNEKEIGKCIKPSEIDFIESGPSKIEKCDSGCDQGCRNSVFENAVAQLVTEHINAKPNAILQ